MLPWQFWNITCEIVNERWNVAPKWSSKIPENRRVVRKVPSILGTALYGGSGRQANISELDVRFTMFCIQGNIWKIICLLLNCRERCEMIINIDYYGSYIDNFLSCVRSISLRTRRYASGCKYSYHFAKAVVKSKPAKKFRLMTSTIRMQCSSNNCSSPAP